MCYIESVLSLNWIKTKSNFCLNGAFLVYLIVKEKLFSLWDQMLNEDEQDLSEIKRWGKEEL